MKCEDCSAHLVDHAYDELESDDAREVSRHLADCSECALEFCRLRADLDGIAPAYAETPRPKVAAELRARVEREFSPPWWRSLLAQLRRPVPVYGAVAAAVLPVVAWLGVQALRPPGADAMPRSATGPVLIEEYDASTVLRVDPNLL